MGREDSNRDLESVNVEQELNAKDLRVTTEADGVDIYRLADYADMGAAIQTALDEKRAVPTSAGIIIPPTGTGATVSSPIDHPGISAWHANLEGVVVGRSPGGPPHGSVLTSAVGSGNHVIQRLADTGGPDRGTLLRNFAVEGDGTEQDGIHWEEWVQFGGVENVIVGDVGRDGFHFETGIYSMTFDRAKAYGCGRYGHWLGGDANANKYENPQATNCSSDGMFFDGTGGALVGNTVVTPTFGSNGGYGFRQVQGGSTVIKGGDIELNTSGQIRLVDVQGADIDGVQMNGGTTGNPNVQLDGAENVTVSGRSNFDSGDSTTPHVRLSGGAVNVVVEGLYVSNGGPAVKVATDLTGGNAEYHGPPSEVDNTTGATLTNPVICYGDDAIYYKKSTGTGYDGGTNDTQL